MPRRTQGKEHSAQLLVDTEHLDRDSSDQLSMATIQRIHGASLASKLADFLRSGGDGVETVTQEKWLEFVESSLQLDAQHFTIRCLEHNVLAAERREQERLVAERRAAANAKKHEWSADDRYEESHLYVDEIPEDRVVDILDFKFFLFRKVYTTPFVQVREAHVEPRS